ncbi:MAG: hypothetical protein Fur0035_10800 [Anaerolineales bacterium]
MKPILILLFLALALSACGPAVSATPAPAAQATPDAGFVSIVADTTIKSVRVLAAPQSGAAELGQVLPGQRGSLLGHDESGQWLLVQFEKVTGWIPIQVVQLTSDY